jgi:hypothetical protein
MVEIIYFGRYIHETRCLLYIEVVLGLKPKGSNY